MVSRKIRKTFRTACKQVKSCKQIKIRKNGSLNLIDIMKTISDSVDLKEDYERGRNFLGLCQTYYTDIFMFILTILGLCPSVFYSYVLFVYLVVCLL